MPPAKRSGPQPLTTENRSNVKSSPRTTDTATIADAGVSGLVRRPDGTRRRPALAPASVYAPTAERTHWWYCYPCRVCGGWFFGRARDIDSVTSPRRAGCGHWASVMIARIYGSPDPGAAA